MSHPARKVLVIRFSSIGDIVLTSPVVRCLKRQLGAEVHYLTKAAFAAVVSGNPYLDKVFTIKKEVSEVLPELRKEQYDCIIDLHKNLRSLQVWLGLRVKRYAFDKLNWEKWLMVRFKINRLPEVHIVDRNLAAVAALGVVNDGQGLDYFIPAADEVNPADLIQPEEGSSGIRYLAFVIGAAHDTKRLPTEKIISICRKIPEHILLLGGPGEEEEGNTIARAAGAHVINTCGKLRLNQSASVVRQALQVISHDTGLMHVAAAFSKPIVSVWGNTIPEFGMYPYYPEGISRNKTMEVKGLSCRPCSKIGFSTCPQGHFKCMQDLDEAALVAGIIDEAAF